MEIEKQKNKTNLTLGSLFDGSGGFPLAGVIAGITPVFNSEIEPFAVRLTEVRFPTVKHYGDISRINGADIPPVDIITFGSPCQDMSVAGKRAGLEGSRSNLFYQATRIIKEMREETNGEYPRYAVWENVPGAFSSNKGEDFRCVLEEMCSIKDPEISVPQCRKWESAGKILGDGYSVAWRLLDAQYWGVPQRRKRIYLVADFGGWSADKVLFESEGLSGYSAESFRAWQASAGCFRKGFDQAGSNIGLMFKNHSKDSRYMDQLNVSQTALSVFGTRGSNQPFVVQTPKTLKIRCGCEGGGKGPLIQDDLSATLSTHNDQTLFQSAAFGICSRDSNAMKSDNPNSGFYEANTSRCLDANGGNPSCNQGGIAVVEGNETLCAGDGDSAVSHPVYTTSKNSYHTEAEEDVASTLVATDYKDPPTVTEDPYYIVRRLTPIECARLQGFPDWWCDELVSEDPTDEEIEKWMDIFETHRKALGKDTKPKTANQIRKWLKNPYSDSATYKMWGNGVALPNVYFVLAGIAYYAQIPDYLL